MRAYICDIETCPLAESELIALMPDNIREPIMPESIKNPPPVDLSKCPQYGGSEEKQNAWKANQTGKHAAEIEQARASWEEKAIEAKQRFIEDAALSPLTASVKMLGIKDCASGIVYLSVAGATAEQKAKLDAGKYPVKIEFAHYDSESDMLSAFSSMVNRGTVVRGNQEGQSSWKLITFYGENFDLPFIFKRCWMLGTLAPWMLRKGRYWNSDLSCDLQQLWTFADRSQKSGGLDAVSKALGTRRKTGSGEYFYKLWETAPFAAVRYHLDDLQCTEEVATKMGIVQ